MEIKKLTKEEKAEGLTLDLVNKVDLLKKCSPVMFKGGDEPVGIMECSTGYWVHTSDGYLRDDKGNYNLLLDIMGIEKIPNPISFKLDSEDDMRMLKNAFGKQAIDEAQGDVNKLYARLKVEQMYNV